MSPKAEIQVKVADLPQVKEALEAAHDALTLASSEGWDLFNESTREAINRALERLEGIGAYA